MTTHQSRLLPERINCWLGFSYHLVKYTRQAIEEAKKATEEVKKQMTLGKEHYTGDQQVISRLE